MFFKSLWEAVGSHRVVVFLSTDTMPTVYIALFPLTLIFKHFISTKTLLFFPTHSSNWYALEEWWTRGYDVTLAEWVTMLTLVEMLPLLQRLGFTSWSRLTIYIVPVLPVCQTTVFFSVKGRDKWHIWVDTSFLKWHTINCIYPQGTIVAGLTIAVNFIQLQCSIEQHTWIVHTVKLWHTTNMHCTHITDDIVKHNFTDNNT